MSLHPRLSQFFAIGSFALLAACAGDRSGRAEADLPRGETVEPGQAQTTEDQTMRGESPMGVRSESTTEVEPEQWRITAVVIDVGLAELCGIDKAEANFDYDSARLDEEAKTTISALTDCFVDGPLAGRDVVLVGHADPRGPDDYNRELGMSRAEAVAQQLIREGLASTRIDVESHGEEHAAADPSEWPDNRRVDVMIAN